MNSFNISSHVKKNTFEPTGCMPLISAVSMHYHRYYNDNEASMSFNTDVLRGNGIHLINSASRLPNRKPTEPTAEKFSLALVFLLWLCTNLYYSVPWSINIHLLPGLGSSFLRFFSAFNHHFIKIFTHSFISELILISILQIIQCTQELNIPSNMHQKLILWMRNSKIQWPLWFRIENVAACQ